MSGACHAWKKASWVDNEDTFDNQVFCVLAGSAWSCLSPRVKLLRATFCDGSFVDLVDFMRGAADSYCSRWSFLHDVS